MISEHIMRTHALAGTNNSSKNNRNQNSNGTQSGSGSQSQRTGDRGGNEDQNSLSLSQRLRRAVVQYSDTHSHSQSHSHTQAHTQSQTHSQNVSGSQARTLLPTEVMRKYIEYARRYCNPKLTKAAAKVNKSNQMQSERFFCFLISLHSPLLD